MVLIPNNASLAIEAKDNSTLIATAGEKGKIYVLKCVDCVHYCIHMCMIWNVPQQARMKDLEGIMTILIYMYHIVGNF